MAWHYYREQLEAAVKRLPESEDLLASLLSEIIADLEEARAVS
jgi:hypothetical protein